MKIRKPTISVCIPLFNGEKYLKECLDTVLSQSICEFEIILIDDCSTDSTYAIAQEFARRDDRITLLRNTANLGLVGNWNRCIELARGEWIKFVFQDDLIHRSCLESLLRAATSRTMLVACHRTVLFDEGTRSQVLKLYSDHALVLCRLFTEGPFIAPERLQRFAIEDFGCNPLGEPTAVMFRRRAVNEVGPFNSTFVSSCDLEFWLRLGVHHGAVVVPEELASFRVHAAATSASNLDRRYYRWFFLDNLILLHQFIYLPAFEPLQRFAKNNAVDLQQMLNDKKQEARAVAVWESQAPKLDRSLLAELEQLTRIYPRLATGRIPHYIWRLRRRFPGLWSIRGIGAGSTFRSY